LRQMESTDEIGTPDSTVPVNNSFETR
jgi:hypothetical protein